ncbi:WecB/TagA/CpsF family glycosyltransferase [Leucobacter sp. Z1108]|uniref:WecB/TagA/CpsF family glycosyltransferase n=1 Tax=Leucobacter sp. Z1108 TaxID=3439066 RepID=UPI003F2B332B
MRHALRWFFDEAIHNRLGTSIRFTNAYCVALADTNREYGLLLQSSGVNFPDGTPVVWFLNSSRKMSLSASRVRGPSFFAAALDEGQKHTEVSHFFLGGSPQALELLMLRIKEKYPLITVAGSYSPPFGPVDRQFLDSCAEEVRLANPSVIWIGLGTPKQDHVGAELSCRLGIPSAGVGAAFDFMAGTVREAPAWLQNSGLEWLFRWAVEPRRLWRRYVFGNARFLKVALRRKPYNER